MKYVKLAMIALFLMASAAGAQELTASYYSIESLKKEGTYVYSHGVMANGDIFTDHNFTCGSWDYPLGSVLRVSRIDDPKHRSVVVKVTDRTARRFKGERIDLSYKAFGVLANHKQGLARVRVEILQHKNWR